jgi:hypothetical protein
LRIDPVLGAAQMQKQDECALAGLGVLTTSADNRPTGSEELANSGRFTKLLAVQAALAKEIATRKATIKSKAQAG